MKKQQLVESERMIEMDSGHCGPSKDCVKSAGNSDRWQMVLLAVADGHSKIAARPDMRGQSELDSYM